EGDHLVAVEDECLAGGDRKAGRTRGDHRLDRRDTYDRYVEPHVLIGLRDFHDRELAVCKFTGPPDRRVGSFHRLDRDACLRSYDDGLSEIEPRDLIRDMQPVFDIAKL